MITEEFEAGSPKFTLGRVNSQPIFLEPFEEFLDSVKMALLRSGEDHNVVHIDETVVQTAQDMVHELLERLWGVAQPHRQPLVPVHAPG